MKKSIIIFLTYILTLSECYKMAGLSTEKLVNAEPQLTKLEYKYNYLDSDNNSTSYCLEDNYMLQKGCGFYKGQKNRSEIKTITFTHIAPTQYDECWNANVSNTNTIKGYRIGTDVFIVGEHIYANKMCVRMFESILWPNLIEINGLELLDMSKVVNMRYMFAGGQFRQLNGIENWDTSNVTSMAGTFSKCTKLTTLDISSWDVSNVTNFSSMFAGNNWVGDMSLRYLDVSQWDTSSAEDMSGVFYGCALLTSIPVENWDVSNVTTFSHMFADCFNLQNIDFSKWDTSSAKTFDAFLNDCKSLVTVDVSSFDTKSCKQFSQMFERCENLENIIGLNEWDVSKASEYAFSETFYGCYNLKEINISNWIATPDNTSRMFKDCHSITQIDLSGFDMSKNVYKIEMFDNCKNLKKIIGYV